MWREKLGRLWLASLLQLATACGGQAAVDETMKVEDRARPPVGFYELTTVTRNDTCTPRALDGTRTVIAGGTESVVLLTFWDNRHFEIPWLGTSNLDLKRCGGSNEELPTPIVRTVHDVGKITPHSFEVVSTWYWDDPTACGPSSDAINPIAPCSVEKTDSYELLDACPATLNGVSCPAPSK